MVFLSDHNTVEVNYGPLDGVLYDQAAKTIYYHHLMVGRERMFYYDTDREISISEGSVILTRFTPSEPSHPLNSKVSARMLMSDKRDRDRLKSIVQQSINRNIDNNIIANHDGKLELDPHKTYTIGPLTVHGDRYIVYDGIRFYRNGLVEKMGYNNGYQPTSLEYRWYLHAYNNKLSLHGGIVTYNYHFDTDHITARFDKDDYQYELTFGNGQLLIDVTSEREIEHYLSEGWGLPGTATQIEQRIDSMTLATYFDNNGNIYDKTDPGAKVNISDGDHFITMAVQHVANTSFASL
jgi:hypothetical protein